MIPGEIICDGPPLDVLDQRPVLRLTVVNAGDRPIQVGSHYHFAEANPALAFDRVAGRGHRLAIPAGTSVRFEPGIERTVDLIPLAGRRIVAGLRNEVAGPLDLVASEAPGGASVEGVRADPAGSGPESSTGCPR